MSEEDQDQINLPEDHDASSESGEVAEDASHEPMMTPPPIPTWHQGSESSNQDVDASSQQEAVQPPPIPAPSTSNYQPQLMEGYYGYAQTPPYYVQPGYKPRKKSSGVGWVVALVVGLVTVFVVLPVIGFIAAMFYAVQGPTSIGPQPAPQGSGFYGTQQTSITSGDPYQYYIDAAWDEIAADDYSAALLTIENVLIQEPEHGEANLIRGDALRFLNRYPEAKAAYRKAQKNAKGSDRGLVSYGLASSIINDPDNLDYSEAVDLLKKAPRQGLEKDAAYFGLLGKMHHYENNNAKALPLFDQALALDPDRFFVLHYRGALYEEEGRYEEALVDLDLALSQDENGYTRLNRGKVHYRLGNYELAIVDLKQSIKMLPDDPEPRYFLAYCYDKQGKPGMAIRDLKLVLRISPEDVVHQIYMGTLLNRAGFYESAIGHLKRLPDYCREDPDYYWELGFIALERQDYEIAIPALEQYALKEENYLDRIQVQNELVEIYWELGRYEKMRETLAKIEVQRQLQPVEWMWKARAYREEGLHDQVLATFEQGLEAHPDSTLLWKWYVDGAYTENGIKPAMKLIDRMLERWPEDEWIWYQKAMMLSCDDDRDLRNSDEALEALKKAADLSEAEDRSAWFWSIHASVYAQAGDFEKAVEAQTRALLLADDHEISDYEREMQWYQNREPYGGLLEPREKDEPTHSGGNEA